MIFNKGKIANGYIKVNNDWQSIYNTIVSHDYLGVALEFVFIVNNYSPPQYLIHKDQVIDKNTKAISILSGFKKHDPNQFIDIQGINIDNYNVFESSVNLESIKDDVHEIQINNGKHTKSYYFKKSDTFKVNYVIVNGIIPSDIQEPLEHSKHVFIRPLQLHLNVAQ